MEGTAPCYAVKLRDWFRWWGDGSKMLTVSRLMKHYFRQLELSRKPSVSTIKYQTRRILRRWGDLGAEELTTEKIDEYRQERLTDGVRPTTINREVAYLRAAYRHQGGFCPSFGPEKSKNRRVRILPLYGPLRALLRRRLDLRVPGLPLVFFRQGGVPIRDLRGVWRGATKRAGLEGLLFHDLRRSAVRNMLRAGLPRYVAKQISGHKTDSVFERYAIVDERDFKEAGQKLERFFDAE